MTTTTRYAPYLLWCDTETTGLDHRTDTVLEVGWFITCADGIPITPVRSRFTALHPDDSPHIPEEGGYWDSDILPEYAVREMHDASRLTTEHGQAQTESNVIHHTAVIERLMLDDLARAHRLVPAQNPDDADDVRASTLTRLAGDGVAHFELPQFRLHFPAVLRALHYRPHDISNALDVITRGRGGGSAGIDAILARNMHKAAAFAAQFEVGAYPTFGLRDQMDDDIARHASTWLLAPHRAYTDAMRACITYRLLLDGGAIIPWRSAPTDDRRGSHDADPERLIQVLHPGEA